MLGILLLAVGWIFFSAEKTSDVAQEQIAAPQKGFLAPDFSLENLDGEQITLSDLRGRAVLLNFWATWCPPCRNEMPAFERVYQDYAEDGFIIIAVNATAQDTLGDVEPFRTEFGLSFPILLDKNGEVNRLYQVQALPTSFFIDSQGIITEVMIGEAASEALIRAQFEKMLPEN
jgi:peroxiredoxin